MKKLTSYIDFGKPYLFFTLALVASLPFARIGMSVAQFSILGLWFLEGNFRQKYKDLINSKAAIILIAFYLLHLIGLLYTSDYEYGLKDIRIKLPLIFLPVVFATSEKLRNQNFSLILKVYIASVLVATLYSLYLRLTTDVSDFRQLSPFISHIRLSLNVCLALFFSMYFGAIKYRGKIAFRFFFFGISFWFLMFLVMIESITGIFILIAGGYILIIYSLFKLEKGLTKSLSVAIIVLIPILSVWYFNYTVKHYFTPKNSDIVLENFTAHGNAYRSDTIPLQVENGSWIGLYICEPELRKAWNGRSSLDYDGKDEKGQDLKFTLFRYMNSLGLRKDMDGMKAMSARDIRNVEMGIANVVYTKNFSLNSRLYKIFWEYQIMEMGLNPGGHSVIQRFEYWKTAVRIISKHFIFGVGTGDVKQAFIDEYQSGKSVLAPQYQHRSHNQYLAIFTGFGLVGFILFIISLVYPALLVKRFFTYHYFVFWLTMVISMLVEDSLETQVGVTLFAFFNTFLLFAHDKGKNE